MNVMIENLLRTLRETGLLHPQQPILVGVSGGPDSLCLLDALYTLGYPVIAAHFNHRLRAAAGSEAQFVERFASQRGIPATVGEGDAGRYAADHGVSIEEAARELRYPFLFGEAERLGAQAVAVGHTADDQVETALMHFLRGAGLAGLKGMLPRTLPTPWSQTLPLIRPLLGVWRSEVLAYCQARQLQPVFDESNEDVAYFRNRLRLEILPQLEALNPGLRQRLWRSTQSLAGDFELVSVQTEAAWCESMAETTEGALSLQAEKFLAYPAGLQRNLLRRAIAGLRPGARDLSFEMVEHARAFFATPSRSGQADLGLGLRMAARGGCLWLARWEAELPLGDYPQALPGETPLIIPGATPLAGGWQLHARQVEDGRAAFAAARGNDDPFQCWIHHPGAAALSVRGRLPGDRFEPLGMGGKSMKISDFMINQKIPARARAGWPLVCAGKVIAWAPGYRIAQSFRLVGGEAAGDIIHLQVAPEE